MNISKTVENRGKNEEKTIAVARFWMTYKTSLASMKPIIMAASVARGTTSVP